MPMSSFPGRSILRSPVVPFSICKVSEKRIASVAAHCVMWPVTSRDCGSRPPVELSDDSFENSSKTPEQPKREMKKKDTVPWWITEDDFDEGKD
ncbi:hypothetical protein ACRRTK_003326 [Alexandromys fortis]